jgi:formylglycine-generating enzyme required for sulfatase activity
MQLRFFAIVFFCACFAKTACGQVPRQPVVIYGGAPLKLYEESHALVVWVSDYLEWPTLPNAQSNGESVSAALRKQDFSVREVPNPNARELANALKGFLAEHGRKKNARLIVYYAGHGHSIGRTGFLVPKDAPLPSRNETVFREMALSMTGIAADSLDSDSRHILYVFDSCFSGAIFTDRAVPASLSLDAADITKYLVGPAAQPVRQFLTAGNENQKVPDISQFTPLFISAISGHVEEINRGGYISMRDVGFWISRKLTEYRTNQTPRFGTIQDARFDVGDMSFQVEGFPARHSPPNPLTLKHSAPKCIDCPEFVVLHGGRLVMGAPNDQPGRQAWEQVVDVDMLPFEMSIHKITIRQFADFVSQTKYEVQARCPGGVSWRSPGFTQKGDHPVVCVGHADAEAFASWMTAKIGEKVALPSSAQWEFAAKDRSKAIALSTRPYRKEDFCLYANIFDRTAGKTQHGIPFPCEDGSVSTTSVNDLRPNEWGLHSVIGNTKELLADCNASNSELPKNGAAHVSTGCPGKLVAGAAFDSEPYEVRTAARSALGPTEAATNVGFRLVKSK